MDNALICFLKYPEPGNVKTRLAEDLDPISAAELYESLAERVITEVYPLEANYEVILFVDPKHTMTKYRSWLGSSWRLVQQHGDDLGDRLNHAFERCFAEGYQRVAVIGTDCIGMDQDFIQDTFAALDEVDHVVGPSTDGGYYLLACKEPSSWIFNDVAWSTDEVLTTTLDKIEVRDLKVKQLEEKIDIDELEDLVKLRDNLPPEHFLCKKIDLLILNRMTLPDEAQDLGDDL